MPIKPTLSRHRKGPGESSSHIPGQGRRQARTPPQHSLEPINPVLSVLAKAIQNASPASL